MTQQPVFSPVTQDQLDTILSWAVELLDVYQRGHELLGGLLPTHVERSVQLLLGARTTHDALAHWGELVLAAEQAKPRQSPAQQVLGHLQAARSVWFEGIAHSPQSPEIKQALEGILKAASLEDKEGEQETLDERIEAAVSRWRSMVFGYALEDLSKVREREAFVFVESLMTEIIERDDLGRFKALVEQLGKSKVTITAQSPHCSKVAIDNIGVWEVKKGSWSCSGAWPPRQVAAHVTWFLTLDTLQGYRQGQEAAEPAPEVKEPCEAEPATTPPSDAAEEESFANKWRGFVIDCTTVEIDNGFDHPIKHEAEQILSGHIESGDFVDAMVFLTTIGVPVSIKRDVGVRDSEAEIWGDTWLVRNGVWTGPMQGMDAASIISDTLSRQSVQFGKVIKSLTDALNDKASVEDDVVAVLVDAISRGHGILEKTIKAFGVDAQVQTNESVGVASVCFPDVRLEVFLAGGDPSAVAHASCIFDGMVESLRAKVSAQEVSSHA